MHQVALEVTEKVTFADKDLKIQVFTTSNAAETGLGSVKPFLPSLFQVFEENMRSMYERSSWGWDKDGKLKEMDEPDMFYLVISATGEKVAGFLSFKLCEEATLTEEVRNTIYCYELQVCAEFQHKGLGSILLGAFEAIGSLLESVDYAMMTVFTFNLKALQFYRRHNYVVADVSPSECLDPEDAKQFDYEILLKKLS